ncbi:coenzyme F420 hydrogenase subunit alpha [Methanobacterium alcaliphilum]|uniref:coenzyme F420 hydrogenase subunit alpha n=1 Tax=Methanobacterium alcaliphilum TaxID=392018 RepID=UPI00200A31CF|nr:coenzyme F420 hydrogenase subunit alpha [Methanobacterium alcaliphilum]MCK9150996.1 coenzyme F420 hydrogenase subunit alpha [Methanobacterium alcaliphilum]
MSERIVISPTSRQEGHAELVMEVDDEGIVTKGRYFSITPVRGLEKIVTGKAPETAPVIVQRICGVCPIPHTLASVEAMDDSLDIEVPKAGQLLRELTLAAHDINSHAIHHFLIAADFVPENLMAAAINSVSEVRKNVQYVVDMVAGEGIHPADVRIGGMADNISELARKRLYARLKQLKPTLDEHVDLMIGLVADKGLPAGLGVHNQKTMATDVLYGNRDNFDLDRFTEIMPESWYDDPEIAKKACSTIPLYDGRNIEVGPRARMAEFQGFKERGVVAQHVARALEMKSALARAIDILDELDTSAPARADFDITGTGKLGIGAIEGPRGMDVHMAQVADGKTQFYSALVPTTWNIPTMGPATEGFHHEFGPHVIRAYDPCLSCATHVIVVDDEDSSVIKNEMVRL